MRARRVLRGHIEPNHKKKSTCNKCGDEFHKKNRALKSHNIYKRDKIRIVEFTYNVPSPNLLPIHIFTKHEVKGVSPKNLFSGFILDH